MKHNENVFEKYGTYYDMFYKDKDYVQESDYFINCLRKLNKEAKYLIELGAGTGSYSQHFCNAGYQVTGIEKSTAMIAESKLKHIANFTPVHADMVSFDLPGVYDAAFALFDVMCYLTKTDDLIACFKNIAKHLKKDGILIFDSWYTPGVYTSIPTDGVKEAENELYYITRHAEPVLNYEQNIVDVNYEFIIKDKLTNQYQMLKEVHTLRHFGVHEIDLLAKLSGFQLINYEELLTGNPIDKNTWKVCYQLQKK